MPGLGKKYRIAPGTQVRQEDFGLLFYTMKGPRLYFLPAKTAIAPEFFKGEKSLLTWLEEIGNKKTLSDQFLNSLERSLDQLIDKGVILEC